MPKPLTVGQLQQKWTAQPINMYPSVRRGHGVYEEVEAVKGWVAAHPLALVAENALLIRFVDEVALGQLINEATLVFQAEGVFSVSIYQTPSFDYRPSGQRADVPRAGLAWVCLMSAFIDLEEEI